MDLRNNIIPPNLILATSSATLPSGFAYECRLNCKYPTGIPCGATNPGTNVGAANHTHSTTGGAHTHTVASAHTHTAGTGTATVTNAQCSTPGTPNASRGPHGHTVTSGPTTPALTMPSLGGHTHTLTTNDPAYKTISFIRFNQASYNLRGNEMSTNVLGIWVTNNSLIPSQFVLDTSNFDKHLKHHTTPGSTGGCNNHIHAANTSHTHTVTDPIHSHPAGTASPASAPFFRTISGAAGSSSAHTHPIGSTAISNSVAVNTASGTSCPSTHQHASAAAEPAFYTVSLMKQNSICMRGTVIPKDTLGLWLEPLACIPSGYALNTAMYARSLKVTLNACTNPGVTGGTNSTHTDSSGGAHTHTLSLGHCHPSSGSLGGSSLATLAPNFGPSSFASTSHAHVVNANTTVTTNTSPLASTGAHTHGTGTIRPAQKEVAYIQKV